MTRTIPCPCCSGRSYAQCCEVFHRGPHEAPDAESLMRSRYAAFARGEVAYLWATLDEAHPDRARPRSAVVAALRDITTRRRFPGLVVLDRAAPNADGVARVLFHARVFEKGHDHSFVECSDFLHDGYGWRYLSGVMAPSAAATATPTIPTFLARYIEA